MEFRKDWSLAYFLLYMCQISYWLIVLNVGIELVMSPGNLPNDRVMVRDVPVNMELQQFEEHTDIELSDIRLHIPERVHSELHFSGPYDKVRGAYFFFTGLNLYKNAVFFFLLFMLSKLLKNVAEGNPFMPQNTSYLYVIGWTLIATWVLNFTFQFLIMGHFISLPLFNELNLPDGIDITSLNLFGQDFLMAGIFVIVLGYVFQEGTRIYEEQKLTV